MKEKNTVSFSSEELRSQKSQTDMERVQNMTEAEIEQNALADMDAPPIDDWDGVYVVLPENKTAITIRVSPRVLDFFQRENKKGYQRRINAVLEAYVDQSLRNNA